MAERDSEETEDPLAFILDPEKRNSRNKTEEGIFQPDKFIRLVDRFFSNAFHGHIGLLVGLLYVLLTYVFAGALWLGLTFLLTYSEFYRDGISIALLCITVGTFVLMAGSNLVEHFAEENLNFQAYVHNSITFFASGIALLGGAIFRILSIRYSFVPPVDGVINTAILAVNLLGGFLFMSSVWVALKLLWRLNQLVFWARDYENTLSPYSEFKASIAGLEAGLRMSTGAVEMNPSQTTMRDRVRQLVFPSLVGYFIYRFTGDIVVIAGYVVFIVLIRAIFRSRDN